MQRVADDLRGPVERLLPLVQALELHGELAFEDLVRGEDLQVAGPPKAPARGDEPLSRVVLIPFDSIAIIHWELQEEEGGQRTRFRRRRMKCSDGATKVPSKKKSKKGRKEKTNLMMVIMISLTNRYERCE